MGTDANTTSGRDALPTDPDERMKGSGSPAYLSGLLLCGRKVVVVGGGHVTRRRMALLLQSGAQVTVVSPSLHPDLETMAAQGTFTWTARPYSPGDLDGAWYVMAATDVGEVNAEVAAAAEAQHTFCVRADDAWAGSAWTPATGTRAGVTIGVLGQRDPAMSSRIRDVLLTYVDPERNG